MTTPDSHRDTYAESYHREFFANYARGIPPGRCAGVENHDTASICGLVGLPPVIMAALREDDAAAVEHTRLEHLRLTHVLAGQRRVPVAGKRTDPRPADQPLPSSVHILAAVGVGDVNPVGRTPAKYRVYGSDKKGFTVHDEPYDVRLGMTKELTEPVPRKFRG